MAGSWGNIGGFKNGGLTKGGGGLNGGRGTMGVGMGVEASTTGLCCKMDGSKNIFVIQLWDLVLNNIFPKYESNWISCKFLRFSGRELAL